MEILPFHEGASIHGYRSHHGHDEDVNFSLEEVPDEWLILLYENVVKFGPAGDEIIAVIEKFKTLTPQEMNKLTAWLTTEGAASWSSFVTKTENMVRNSSRMFSSGEQQERIRFLLLSSYRNAIIEFRKKIPDPSRTYLDEIVKAALFGLIFFNYYDKVILYYDYLMLTYPVRKLFGKLQEDDPDFTVIQNYEVLGEWAYPQEG